MLEQLIRSVEASVPGLSLQGSVGDLRPAPEFFPDQSGDSELAVDPALRLRELGVVLSYNGDDGWGYRGSVSSDPSTAGQISPHSSWQISKRYLYRSMARHGRKCRETMGY